MNITLVDDDIPRAITRYSFGILLIRGGYVVYECTLKGLTQLIYNRLVIILVGKLCARAQPLRTHIYSAYVRALFLVVDVEEIVKVERGEEREGGEGRVSDLARTKGRDRGLTD